MMGEKMRVLPQPILMLVTVVVLAVVSLSVRAIESDPVQLLKQTNEELFAQVELLRDDIEEHPQLARDLVRRILTPHMDLKRIARWVLGKHWRRASEEQRDRFITEFRTMLVRTYASALTSLSRLELVFLPLKGDIDSKDVTVRTMVPQDGAQPITVDYRMHLNDDGWKVYDVKVDGVSLVTTYRSSFGQLVRTGGMDGLIERLAEKNRENARSS